MNTTTTPEFISVGALGEGFAVNNNILEVNEGLNGQDFTLHFPGGRTHEFRILNSQTLVWDGREQDARVTSVRDGIYFVDFLMGESVKKSVSLVLDNNSGQVTLIDGALPDEQATSINAYDRARQGTELTGVEAAILHGSVGGKQGGTAHAPTDELIGLRNRYHYSPEEVYEHVYLNNNFYTWHWHQGLRSRSG
ncbi:MoaF N-terminal domain-containing protein [Arthrobacter sp. alpha11c]